MSDIAQRFTDAFTVRKVFGEPIKQGGQTLIPVAKIAGGSGGDAGGSGFGGAAKPIGTLVLDGEHVRWRPTVEPAHVLAILGFVLTTLLCLRACKHRHHHKHAGHGGHCGCRCHSDQGHSDQGHSGHGEHHHHGHHHDDGCGCQSC